ncbi:MAG TPA: ABC transporter permease [Candidatus Bathyarchaeia archaeon]
MTAKTSPSWMTRFWAVVRYEILWNIRKKKFIGMIIFAFVFATLSLTLPVILTNVNGQPLDQNPDYVITSGAGIGGIALFLFAVVTVMNSISGEFESGTIVPLLTKPVSRTMVFLGKLFAAFIILLSAYFVLFLYMTIGGTVIFGPQNNLHLVPLVLLGNVLSTFVWIAIVLAIGSISKSSMIAALGAFGIFIALSISASIVSVFSDQMGVLTYVPGGGATGYIKSLPSQASGLPGLAVSTGTDGIGASLITYILHPSAEVTFSRMIPPFDKIYSEPISVVASRSIAVAIVYMLAFLFIAWYFFKRAQILE